MTASANKIKILPSILSADFGSFLEEAKTVDIPEIEYLHIDVMDGHFVPNMTIGPQVIESLKQNTRFKFDVHLMIDNAPQYLQKFAEAGADTIIVHQEAVMHLNRVIHQIKDLGVKAGVTINPATSLETLRWVLKDVDQVLILSVNPGFGGQEFIKNSLDRIARLKQMRREAEANFIIEVDGGINAENAGHVVLAGAQYLVIGSAIFTRQNREKAITEISGAVDVALRQAASKFV